MPQPTKTSLTRLKKELIRMKRDPPPYITASPNPDNLLEWHYIITDIPNCIYSGIVFIDSLNVT